MSGRTSQEIMALYIKWVDAKTWSNDWVDADDLEGFELPMCESRGAVIKEDSSSIFLAQTTSDEENRNIIGIPKGCILKRKKIP